MFFLYGCIVICTAMQSATTKLFSRENDDVMLFNAIKAVSALLLIVIMSRGELQMHAGTAVYGGLYGLMMCISMYSGYIALAVGPMSLTSLIVSFSVVMTVFYGVAFCGEALSVLKVTGVLFLIAAIVFVNINNAKTEDIWKSRIKWSVYVFLTFVSNGFCSIMQKMHQIRYKSMYCLEFMLFAMLVSSTVFVAVNTKKILQGKCVKSGGKKYAVLSGVSNAVAGYSTIKLAGFEEASILFPTITAGTILCSMLCGTLIFKEKLRYNHFIAILGGIAAVVFFKL